MQYIILSDKSSTMNILGGKRALLRTELVYKTSFGVLALGIRKKKKQSGWTWHFEIPNPAH